MDTTIHIVDDDLGIRRSLERSFAGLGLRVETYDSAERFLERVEWGRPGCLVVDLMLPGMSGLELLKRVPADDPLQVVVLTGYADVSTAVRAMKCGAVDVVEKSTKSEQLISTVREALEASREAAQTGREASLTRKRLSTLTPAERAVLDGLLAGRTTAEIAATLHRSDRTIGNHRQHILRKMGARNTPELIRMMTLVLSETPVRERRN